MGDMPISAVDVAIIGAGAAGLMCGIQAGKRGRRVLIVEHNARIGRKILISGGGRCNFTNIHTGPENFLSANPHFAKSALARYGPRDFLALVERHGFRYHEKTLGQLFCDGAAAEIVSMLEQECAAAGVRIAPSCEVRGIARNDGPGYCLETTHGTVHASSLVIASGGLSVPKIGASPLGYDVARQFGLQIVDCRPALVPLTFSAGDRSHFQDLAGVSADCTAEAGGRCFRERLLFTHRGLSGPAILQASSYWRPGERVNIDLAPGVDVAALFRAARTAADRVEARTPAARFLPKPSESPIPSRLSPIARSRRSPTACTAGRSRRREPKGTAKQRSLPGEWTQPSFPPRLSKLVASRACSSSAKSSMSPANSAASISSGLGRLAIRRGSLCEPQLLHNRVHVVFRFRDGRHAARLVHRRRSGIVGSQGARHVAFVFVQ